MDFDLPDNALSVRDGVAAVAAKYDHDYWSRCEDEKRYPSEIYHDLAAGGWLGLSVPEEYGGGGQGLLETAIACETLCASGGTAGSFFYVLNPGFGVTTLARHGTEEQKQQILPGLATGEIQFSFGLTEPDAGSNAVEISTSASKDGDDYLIKGQKIWISNVERADWMVAVTRTIPAREATPRTAGFTLFLVDVKDALSAGTLSYTPIPKMGSNILCSSQVFFDDVRVPADRVLGQVDEGFRVLWDVLNPERILAAAGAVGAADAALQVAADYARERVVFGKPIGANQSIAFPLAQIKAKTELARLMTYKAAWLFDQGRPCGSEANVAKLTAAQASWEAADQAFQTLGGMAYSKEYPVERMFRDARIGKNIPVSEQMVLAHISSSMLDLPKTYWRSTPMSDPLAERQEIEALVKGRSIAHAFADTVGELGDSPAFSDKIGIEGPGWRTLTWNELREQGLEIAAAFVELGVQPGDRVAIMASNRLEHVLADLGTMHAGATSMSIYNTLSRSQVAYVAEHSAPRVVVLETADHVDRWSEALATGMIEHVVVIDATDRPAGALTWDELVDLGRSKREQHGPEVDQRWQATDPDSPATILYTSGTTGNPKGVVITHHNVLFEVESGNRTAGLAEYDGDVVVVSYLPFAHIAERVLSIYIPQVGGGHVHLIGDPAQLVGALGEVRPTHFFGVPRVWEKIQTGIGGLLAMETDETKKQAVADAMAVGLEHVESLQLGHETSPDLQERFDAVDAAVLTPMKSMLGLDRVYWAGSASAPMPLETARFFAGLGMPIYDIYGMTETTGAVTAGGPGRFKLGTVGQAQPGIEIAIADDGEILTRGPVNTSGYHKNPEASAELIDPDGWIHTGDIGEIDDDGFLKVVDRKKEMIITSSGKNIAPSNIENLLKESALVGHALAYGESKPYVVAILTLDPDVAPVMAGKLGVEYTDLADLAQKPEILGIVGQAVEKANERLSRPEQVKKWKLLPVEWTAESAELTPTLKLKRRVVHANYAEALAELYA